MDFIALLDGKIIPFEVHSGKDGRYGSLRAYMEKYDPEIAVLTTMNPYAEGRPLKLPLYAMAFEEDIGTLGGKSSVSRFFESH